MTDKTSELLNRIEGSLIVHSEPKVKEFWYGFITGLYDYKVIDQQTYQILRDTIYTWKKR
jgi:hypothetical protein